MIGFLIAAALKNSLRTRSRRPDRGGFHAAGAPPCGMITRNDDGGLLHSPPLLLDSSTSCLLDPSLPDSPPPDCYDAPTPPLEPRRDVRCSSGAGKAMSVDPGLKAALGNAATRRGI